MIRVYPYSRSLRPACIILLAFLAACTTTRFPEDPEEHPLFEELQAAGDEYYFNVSAGVKSRVLGILPESEARAAVDEIKRRWREIEPLRSAEDVAAYMDVNGLPAIGQRVLETLDENRPDEPIDGADERLEAAAVKQGLVEAAFELDASE